MSRPNYGWVITKTEFADEAAGQCGPRGLVMSIEKIKTEGLEFRLRDDDGELYYTGFYLGPDDETKFAPLDDYGMPNAGATVIEYRGESGEWERL